MITDYSYAVYRPGTKSSFWSWTVGFDKGRGHIKTGRAFTERGAHRKSQLVIALCIADDLGRIQKQSQQVLQKYEVSIK